MSDDVNTSVGHPFDLERWISLAGPDKVSRRKRQVAEITLHAIALERRLGQMLVLKGGSLLAIAYGSSRFTTDLDFTALSHPPEAPEQLATLLNPALIRAAAALGYADLHCRVQTVRRLPNPKKFIVAEAPALKVIIGSSGPGASERRHLDAGTASDVLELDISYREPLVWIEEVALLGHVEVGGAPQTLLVYSLAEVVAEKLRAYLQQGIRNRSRRQDVFDIAYLIEAHGADLDRAAILLALLKKARARGINPNADMIDDPELISRAKRDWNTLRDEVGQVPEFEVCFGLVRDFYISLPWHSPERAI